VSSSGKLGFEALNTALKAAGEETRLRVLALLAEAELTVSDLTDILRQSQPRISRHLKLLVEAGLVERFREGTWAFFRLAEHGGGADVARALIERLNSADQTIARDRQRLSSVREARAAAAQAYFRAHAAEWDRIRKLHVADEAVEEAIRAALADKPFRSLLDLGTGTGRMLEMFGPMIERGLGLDLSLDMLLLARDRLERAGLRNCSVRQGDIYDLPLANDSFDVVILHQVLHFLDDGARAIREAARVLRPGGRAGTVTWASERQPAAAAAWEETLTEFDVPVLAAHGNHSGLDREDDVASLHVANGLSSPRVWRQPIGHTFTAASYLRMRTAGGVGRARLALVDDATAKSVVAELDRRLRALPPDAFAFSGEVICAVSEKAE
jgi:ubiquinone/menaquinone biosynthesis C-methylase UbiE/Fe2+ or Zn2+ uptake regulation protein